MITIKIGKCEICQTYPIAFEVRFTIERTPAEPSELWKRLSGEDDERPDYLQYDICDRCLAIVKEHYAKRLKAVRPRRTPYVFSYAGFKFWSALRVWMERALHGVSWWEANGLDNWFVPQVITMTGDAELHRWWAQYNAAGVLFLPFEEWEPLYANLTQRLRLVWYAHPQALSGLVPKLRYIFRKYSDAYAYGHPLQVSAEEWRDFVQQVRRMFEDDPFAPRWAETFRLFCERLTAFWW